MVWNMSARHLTTTDRASATSGPTVAPPVHDGLVLPGNADGERYGYWRRLCALRPRIAPLGAVVWHTRGAGGVEVPPLLPRSAQRARFAPPTPASPASVATPNPARRSPSTLLLVIRGGPMADTVVMLEVPMNQKDEAKALGAHWDRDARSW